MINKTKTECETKLCQNDSLTRTRFYNGMLLTAEHLRAEQTYHRESLKRLTRNLFGSGIVCGLTVTTQPRGLCLTVSPGVALDCCGNLIEVCNCTTVDLSKLCKDRYGSECLSRSDTHDEVKPITKYLVLRYDEKLTDPEQVFTPGDECKPAGDKPNCEASKVREGFCIELWDSCPCPEHLPTKVDKKLLETLRSAQQVQEGRSGTTGGTTTETPKEGGEQASVAPRSANPTFAPPPRDGHKVCIDLPLPCVNCYCCEDSNAVGLAKLTIDCKESIVDIVECDCRKYVISPRLLTWLFSVFPRDKYIPSDMSDVREHLGHFPIAQMMGTAVAFEARGDTIEEHTKQFENHTKQFEDLDKRLRALEQPPQPGDETVTKAASKGSKKGSSANPEEVEEKPSPSDEKK